MRAEHSFSAYERRAASAKPSLVGRLWRRLSRRAHIAYVSYLDYRFDRAHDVDTRGFIELSRLPFRSETKHLGFAYGPSSPRVLKSAMAKLSACLETVTFIDFGSGKGRVLLLASEYGFNSIRGVEVSPELHAIAVRNIAKYESSRQQCRDVSSTNADACSFAIPDGDCVLFFFCPFQKEILASELGNLVDSLRRNPRRVFIIYYNPVFSDTVESLACFELVTRYRLAARHVLTAPYDIAIYRSSLEASKHGMSERSAHPERAQ